MGLAIFITILCISTAFPRISIASCWGQVYLHLCHLGLSETLGRSTKRIAEFAGASLFSLWTWSFGRVRLLDAPFSDTPTSIGCWGLPMVQEPFWDGSLRFPILCPTQISVRWVLLRSWWSSAEGPCRGFWDWWSCSLSFSHRAKKKCVWWRWNHGKKRDAHGANCRFLFVFSDARYPLFSFHVTF